MPEESEGYIQKAFFLVVGNGTEFSTLESYATKAKQAYIKLMKSLPKDDYDTLVAACDVGMIFLNHRFTIPNFPSRLLGYMQAKLPVLAVTDPNTDIGNVIVDDGFGWWCESEEETDFIYRVNALLSTDLCIYKGRALNQLKRYYTVEECYKIFCSKA